MRHFVALSLCVAFPALSPAQSITGTTDWIPASPWHNAYFGRAIAVEGSVAVAGASRIPGFSAFTGAVHLLDTATGMETHFVVSPNSVDNGYFGRDVGISGTTAVAGAPGENSGIGRAYLIDVTTGTVTHTLSPLVPSSFEQFGISVDIDGDVVIVGAEYAEGTVANSGAAYLFDRTTGVQLAKLQANDSAASDSFGEDVAIHGNTAIVGARYNAESGDGGGAAYLFDVTTGNQIGKLLAADGAPQDRFGCCVGIDGNIAVVGARRDTPNGGTSGSAYAFDVSLQTQINKFIPSDGAPSHLFGDSIAIHGNLVVIGALGHGLNGDGAGAAYLFDALTGDQRARFLAPNGEDGDLFGQAVAFDGTTALIAAPWRDATGGFINPGTVVPFDDFPPASNTGNAFCFGDGSGAACPCSANGNVGEGCANSGGSGATLGVTGQAYAFNGNFAFEVNGVPGNKPGLLLKANNQVALPAGDGILCVAGGSNRSHIQVTAAGSTTFTDFDGASLPATGGFGVTSNWQFWYRDPANVCSGAGFNFTNAWTVMFMP